MYIYIYIFIFSRTRLPKSFVDGFWRTIAQNTRRDVRKCLFGVHVHDGRQHFVVQISQKPSKTAFYKHVLASENGLKTNDVIEDWRHDLLCRSLAVLVRRRILFIASWESLRLSIYQWLSTKFGTEIQFWQVYTLFVGNLLYKVSHKMIPYRLCCLVWKLQKLRNFDMQAVDIRRTYRLKTGELMQLKWAQVANKKSKCYCIKPQFIR